MEKLIVSATQARKSFFTLLNKAALGEAEVVVIKNDTEKAVSFMPVTRPKSSSWKDFKKAAEEIYGLTKGESDWKDKKIKLSKNWSYKLSKNRWN